MIHHKKSPAETRGFLQTESPAGLHPHAAHSTHATHTAHVRHAAGRLVFSQFSNHALGGQHQAGDGRGVLQCGAGHLGRIEHAHFDHVAVLAGGRVVTVVTLAALHLVDHDRRLIAGVGNDFTQRLLQGAQHDLDAGILIVVVALEFANSSTGADQRHAAAGDDTFFHGSAGGVQGIFNARFLFLHFDFGRGTNLDDGDAASQLGHTFLQLFLVVIGSRFLDLDADLLDARLDRCRLRQHRR